METTDTSKKGIGKNNLTFKAWCLSKVYIFTGIITILWVTIWMLVYTILKIIQSIPLLMAGNPKSAWYAVQTCWMFDFKDD